MPSREKSHTNAADTTSLSRRFTLLRKPTGESATLDDLRGKFAEQRARGAENQISEEEEDMILETLGRIRAKNAGYKGRGTDESSGMISNAPPSASQLSLRSSASISAVRSPKRYSNNLFGSGKFRDYTYVRSMTQPKKESQGARKTGSLSTITPSSRENTDIPLTSDDDTVAPPAQFASDKFSPGVPAAITHSYLDITPPYITPSAVNRASLAFEEAMNQIEEAGDEGEEADDKIVMPRITAARISHTTVLVCLT